MKAHNLIICNKYIWFLHVSLPTRYTRHMTSESFREGESPRAALCSHVLACDSVCTCLRVRVRAHVCVLETVCASACLPLPAVHLHLPFLRVWKNTWGCCCFRARAIDSQLTARMSCDRFGTCGLWAMDAVSWFIAFEAMRRAAGLMKDAA